MINDKDLEEFKELFRTHFKKELTNQEALEKLTALLTMMRNVYKPITQDQLEDIEEYRKEIEERRERNKSD